MRNEDITSQKDVLYKDTCRIIEEARVRAYHAVNASLTIRNWLLGERIAKEELGGADRAEYGKRVIASLADMLTAKYGKGFEKSSLHKYVKFYHVFPEIVATLSPQSEKQTTVSPQLLPWSHYNELLRVENDEARKWYEKEALQEVWGIRTLRRNISTQYYFRLLQSQHKKPVIDEMHKLTAAYQHDKLEFIKNPVVAEFLGLQTPFDFTESELEGSIIKHLQNFIMEMGKGFAFVARQQHIRTDMGDFYIDLVFYNYILKCFFLVDLKTGMITHQDVGQMDMYIRMYDHPISVTEVSVASCYLFDTEKMSRANDNFVMNECLQSEKCSVALVFGTLLAIWFANASRKGWHSQTFFNI